MCNGFLITGNNALHQVLLVSRTHVASLGLVTELGTHRVAYLEQVVGKFVQLTVLCIEEHVIQVFVDGLDAARHVVESSPKLGFGARQEIFCAPRSGRMFRIAAAEFLCQQRRPGIHRHEVPIRLPDVGCRQVFLFVRGLHHTLDTRPGGQLVNALELFVPRLGDVEVAVLRLDGIHQVGVGDQSPVGAKQHIVGSGQVVVHRAMQQLVQRDVMTDGGHVPAVDIDGCLAGDHPDAGNVIVKQAGPGALPGRVMGGIGHPAEFFLGDIELRTRVLAPRHLGPEDHHDVLRRGHVCVLEPGPPRGPKATAQMVENHDPPAYLGGDLEIPVDVHAGLARDVEALWRIADYAIVAAGEQGVEIGPGVGVGQAIVLAQEFALENSVIVLRQLEQEALPVAALRDVLFQLPQQSRPELGEKR